MAKVHKAYPNDLDAAVLYVESLMDLRPWGYWMRDGAPYEGVADAVALIEKVIARNPKHPGALHLYIHLVEAVAPEKAEGAADRLLPLVPAAGHLVHMPAHIYQRVGRYADAIKSNQLAIAADEDYITQCRAQGLYPIGYYPHNLHFLWFAATADGQSTLAIDAARKTASKVDPEMLKQLPLLAAFKVVPYYALTRFGRWDEMLAEPDPGRGNAFLSGIYHYARGVALVGKNRLDDAAKELAAVKATLTDQSLDGPLFSPNIARAVLVDRAGSARRRNRARAASSSTRRSRTSIAPSASRTGSSTPSRRSGTTRRDRRSAARCSSPAASPKPRRSSGKISSAIPRTAGRSAASSRRCARRTRTSRPRSSRRA